MRGDLDSGSPLRGEPEMTPDAPALKRCLIDLPVRAHEPMLICERLAGEPLGMLDGAEFLAFASNDEERHADFIGVAFPGDGLTKAVELVLLSDPRHVH